MVFSFISACLLFLSALYFNIANTAQYDIINNCPYIIWAAAVPGGGQQLNSGETWSLSVPGSITQGRIWPRTNCNFDGSGQGKCQTGDCNGVLDCHTYGTPPNSVAEYALNMSGNLDFFDISLVDGFNVAIEISPNFSGCSAAVRCTADINGQCPSELRAPGGCNNPCTVFKTNEYCCNSGSCGPTTYSKFFKDRCPYAYSYPKDDQTNTIICAAGKEYTVVFCPTGTESNDTIIFSPPAPDDVENGYKSVDMCSCTMVLRSVTKFGSVIAC